MCEPQIQIDQIFDDAAAIVIFNCIVSWANRFFCFENLKIEVFVVKVIRDISDVTDTSRHKFSCYEVLARCDACLAYFTLEI